LFQRLDEYLKTRQMRLREVFDKYDRNGDGELNMEVSPR
jgi:Ca2+-binding EF-hand superfamily protein